MTTVQKTSWIDYTDEKMRAETRKNNWYMFNNLQTEGDLDEATRKFHDVTNKFMNEVAPFKTIKLPRKMEDTRTSAGNMGQK